MSKIEIYYDALQEVEWFVSLDNRFYSATKKIIRERGKNDREIINQLIVYDRPDIILVVDEIPKLVIEKTEEVPSGHNVGQRIGRLARAVELGVPIIKFFPFLAKKHGDYASKCFVRPNIFLAFQKMKQFHKVHAIAINWICDKEGELIRNGSENRSMEVLIKAFINNNFSFENLKEAKDAENEMQEEYNIRTRNNIHYRKLAPSLKMIKTKELVSMILEKNRKFVLNKQLLNRDSSLIYEIVMEPDKCRREDPYTGTQFIYDYCYCRTGPKIKDRKINFVLDFPKITKARWIEANPLNPNRKSFLWYVLADVMIFKDGLLTRENNFEQ